MNRIKIIKLIAVLTCALFITTLITLPGCTRLQECSNEIITTTVEQLIQDYIVNSDNLVLKESVMESLTGKVILPIKVLSHDPIYGNVPTYDSVAFRKIIDYARLQKTFMLNKSTLEAYDQNRKICHYRSNLIIGNKTTTDIIYSVYKTKDNQFKIRILSGLN